MITIKVRLLWSSEALQTASDLLGYYREAEFNITKEDLMEKFQLDPDELFYINTSSVRSFGDLDSHVFDKIEVELGNGELPAGIPICANRGLPTYVYFVDMTEKEEKE
jgi:hypothetical protein